MNFSPTSLKWTAFFWTKVVFSSPQQQHLKMSESNPILEKSLDEIIGDKAPERETRGPRRSGPRRGGRNDRSRPRGVNKPDNRSNINNSRNSGRPPRQFNPNRAVPREIASLAGSRPLLRVKNVHHELTGQDLSQLFDAVAAVEFVKFDPSNDNIAYVCFEHNNAKYNAIAISKFDGRMAMGREIAVESTTSLADRILAAPPRARQERPVSNHDNKRGNDNKRAPKNAKKERPPKPVKKSVDDLDNELNAYMAGQTASDPSQAAPVTEAVPAEQVEQTTQVDDEMTLD